MHSLLEGRDLLVLIRSESKQQEGRLRNLSLSQNHILYTCVFGNRG